MDQLADILKSLAILDRVVANRTGLDGLYKISLNFHRRGENADSISSAPDITTALEQQLGLKLESRKEPIKVLVIDRVERPSSN